MAEPTAATKVPRAPKPAATDKRNNFSATIKALQEYCKMRIEILGELAGDSPSEFSKGRLEELKAIQGRLEAK